MALIVDTKEYLNTICCLLAEGQQDLPVPVTGNSMCPFLHPGDIVYLNRYTELEKGDIVLFTRPDGSFVLHRIYQIKKDGTYLILGDNQLLPEPVPAERIHAIVTSVRIKEKVITPKSLRWQCYAKLWSRPVRRIIGKLHR